MTGLRILITCEALENRGGTELYVRDVALSLLRLGQAPVVYASRLGKIANEIRDLTIPVIDDLDALGSTPDLIFGQHHLPTMTALLHFADVPAIYVCHDWYGHNGFAPRFPRILRFVAVDVTCRDRLLYEDGIEESHVRLLPNSVDLNRFERRPPLPVAPRRALIFGNYTPENPHLAALRRVCAKRGIQLDVVGERMNNAVARPEETLKDYDIVFAKGRAALEALAVGAAVIIYSGVRFLGPMVRADDVERLLPLNFGIRAMSDALAPQELALRVEGELDRYDHLDAARATEIARARAGQAAAMHTIVELCEEVVAEYEQQKTKLDPRSEGPAAAAYLSRLQSLHAHLNLQHQSMQESTVAKLNSRLEKSPRLAGVLRPLLRPLARLFSG
ncbi:MAG: glycosyltransferase [Pyrinomonadaceae bacterium]|nr:glycosyltransferase [Pyrinomonadaceae bacterium]